jgi:hypothetical protein
MCKHGIIDFVKVEQSPQISPIFSLNGYLGTFLSFPDPATSLRCSLPSEGRKHRQRTLDDSVESAGTFQRLSTRIGTNLITIRTDIEIFAALAPTSHRNVSEQHVQSLQFKRSRIRVPEAVV